MLLKDKVAVITGGAGVNGLGFATAKLMAQHGARVAVLDLAACRARRPPPPSWATVISASSPTSPTRPSCEAAVAAVLEGLRPDRHAGQQRRHHAAGARRWTSPTPTTTRVLDVSLRGTL